MSRAERLLDLIQALRRRRLAVAGDDLARELGISLRTLYRDIASLRAQGAAIEGEPGIGYVLRPGFLLPPLMFTENELDALALGAQWVMQRGDSELSEAARNALSKIESVLPNPLSETLASSGLMVGPSANDDARTSDARQSLVRSAIRRQDKLRLVYADRNGDTSHRIIWPLGLGYFDATEVLVAWCELRVDFRYFRLDRIKDITATGERYGGRRLVLLRQWQKQEGIDDAMLTETGSRVP